jgi:hypothetical protein
MPRHHSSRPMNALGLRAAEPSPPGRVGLMPRRTHVRPRPCPALGLALMTVVGCAGGAPFAASSPSLRGPTSSLRVVHTYSKQSAETGRWIIAVLLRGSMGTDGGVAVGARSYLDASSGCTAFDGGSTLRALDRLHPDAVQPPPDSRFAPNPISADVQLTRPSESGASPELEGWLTWQAALPPPGCTYDIHVFIRPLDIWVGNPGAMGYSDAQFQLTAYGVVR